MGLLLSLALLTACQAGAPAAAATPEPCIAPEPWRGVATDADRDRLSRWRDGWDTALAATQPADRGAIAAQGLLFDPDRALDEPLPPAGAYRCRIFKLGAQQAKDAAFKAYPPVACRVEAADGALVLRITQGAQRPTGRLYDGPPGKGVFLGTLVLGDESRALEYGLDESRDMIGYIDHIASRRWRLILPFPRFESLTDVVEISGAE